MNSMKNKDLELGQQMTLERKWTQHKASWPEDGKREPMSARCLLTPREVRQLKKKKASKGLDSTIGTTLFCVAGTETGRNLLVPYWKQAWHQHGQSLDFMFAKQPERKIKFDFYKIISTSELLIILIFWYQKEI